MTTESVTEIIVIAFATASDCEVAESYLTEEEGADISITVRPQGSNDVEGIFVVQNGQRYPLGSTDDLYERVTGLVRDAWSWVAAVNEQQRVDVVLDSAVGAHVTYGEGADVETIDSELPDGWTVDYSNQIELAEGRFRSPLVVVDTRDGDIALAREHLGATDYADETLYAYTQDDVPGVVYLTDADTMADLGARLRRGDDDAYSVWCSENIFDEVESRDVALNIRATDGSREVDFHGWRRSAAAAGDHEMCAALDHMQREISEAIAELDERAAAAARCPTRTSSR